MHPQHPQPAPRPEPQRPAPAQIVRPQPTAWESIPAFIRFMVWVMTILGFVWLIVLPVLAIVAVVGGGLAGS